MDYSSASAWESRYSRSDGAQPVDWYCTFADLAPHLAPTLSRARGSDSFELLIVGCGTSSLPLDLHRAGLRNVSSIDRSPSAVAHQVAAAAAARAEDLDFSVCDATRMGEELPDGVFDAIIDKACGDALLSSGGEVGERDFAALVRECARVCAPGGQLIVVSVHAPALLLPRLLAPAGGSGGEPLWEAQPSVARVLRTLLAEGDGGLTDPYIYTLTRKKLRK